MYPAPVVPFDLEPSVKQFIMFSSYGLGLNFSMLALSSIVVMNFFDILCVVISLSLGLLSSGISFASLVIK